MPVPRTPEGVDKLLNRLDVCLACVENPPESDVKIQKAKFELLSNMEEARNILQEVMRNPSDRALLAQVFGGDCHRIARLQVICESAQQCDLVSADTRLKDCASACTSLEKVVVDLGLKDALEKALASERKAVMDEEDDDDESEEFVRLVAEASVAEAAAVGFEQIGDMEGAIGKYAECVLNLTDAISAAPPDSEDAKRLAEHCAQISDRIEYIVELGTATEEIEMEVTQRRSMEAPPTESALPNKESQELLAVSTKGAGKAGYVAETCAAETHVTGIPIDTRTNPSQGIPTQTLGGAGRTNATNEVWCCNGCGRPPFQQYKTCCTHCKGPDGPHAFDCARKAAGCPPPVEVEEMIKPLDLDMHKNRKKKKKFIRACAAIGCAGGAVMFAPATAVAVGLGASVYTGAAVVAGAAVIGGAAGSSAARNELPGTKLAGKPIHAAAAKAGKAIEGSGVAEAVTSGADRIRAKTAEIDAQYDISAKILQASRQASEGAGGFADKYEVSRKLEKVSKLVAARMGQGAIADAKPKT